MKYSKKYEDNDSDYTDDKEVNNSDTESDIVKKEINKEKIKERDNEKDKDKKKENDIEKENEDNYKDNHKDNHKDNYKDNHKDNIKEKEKKNEIDIKKFSFENKKIQENNNLKRKRTNSESDIYNLKIKERSRYDKYFRKQNVSKQIEILIKEEEVYNYYHTEIPLRYKILYSNLPISTKSLIIQKIDMYEEMDPGESEYNKLTKWFNGLSQIPFDSYILMPVKISDGLGKIQNFLQTSYEILKKTIYGQLEAKNKIMQILAQWISNPKSSGQIIALEGPPGVGKTSLVRYGVSKALNRPFCFYALGGATDISNLEGHSYTYEGAIWGRMVEMLMESKVMNPVIFFDELDKISDTPKGAEISGLLTHLTDPSQNNIFQDKYFSGINLDFSKTVFFFSYNDPNLINPILKDRLTIVKFNGYSIDEKINIVNDYVIPYLLENIGFGKNDIKIEKEMIKYIIVTYTQKEDGVRNVKRVIEDLFLKINLLKLMKNNTEKNNSVIDIMYNITDLIFPLNLTKFHIDSLIKK
jgi:ATP-dependent Lon protease